MGKGENTGYKHYLLFSQCFKKSFFPTGYQNLLFCGNKLTRLTLTGTVIFAFSQQYRREWSVKFSSHNAAAEHRASQSPTTSPFVTRSHLPVNVKYSNILTLSQTRPGFYISPTQVF